MALQKSQRIFVNRSLNLGYIRAIGFDMDHTLAPYNHKNFEDLAFKKTLEKFIEAGYPEELSTLKFDPKSVIRGLLVDQKRGNLLKVDGHKYVKHAFHGKRILDKEERHRLYNLKSFKAEKFLSVDTFFALSEVQLFIELVEFMDKFPKKIQKSYDDVYKDIRKFIDLSHADGSIKKEVIGDPGKYIIQDKNLAETLLRLLDGGKVLFLLTNSHWDYTNVIMSYILENQLVDVARWRDCFEYVIVGSGKPGFFTGSQPFYEVVTESGLLKPHQGSLNQDGVYHGGSANLFQNLTSFRGDEILYVGDHIYGDIIRSKGLFNWRTMLIVEELYEELEKTENLKAELDEVIALQQRREIADEELQKIRSKSSSLSRQAVLAKERGDEKRAATLLKDEDKLRGKFTEKKQVFDQLERDIKDRIQKREQRVHHNWGELMKVGLENSRFAQQVELYACIYTARLSNLRFYSPYKRFVSVHDLLPHDL